VTAAENYGGAGQVSHADRYARGEEFMEVVNELWDSWAADAVVDDRAAGVYARADRIRSIDHHGDFYTVKGPLNMPRCPQGRPVLVQAGSSDTGRRFAARHAEAVFTAHMAKSTAQEFYADLKRLAAVEGRSPEHVLILPGLSPIIASTEAEAQRLAREVNELSDPEVGRKRLSGRFGGYDFSHLPLDRPAGADRRSDRGLVQRWRGRWLQCDAADFAGTVRRLRRRNRAAIAAPRPLPHRIRRYHASRALRSSLAEKRVRRSSLGGWTARSRCRRVTGALSIESILTF
jgi:alkanesulfonate monooxygenase SsuD/methylene tetrahydromethanopterin reductase-like flavin-dependent oxidoreductase (luciferase family)